MAISTSEDMATVDAFDGHNTRKGLSCNEVSFEANPDLLVVSPAIDGRLKDEGKESSGEWMNHHVIVIYSLVVYPVNRLVSLQGLVTSLPMTSVFVNMILAGMRFYTY